MKIHKLEINAFQGIDHVRLDLSRPAVHLFCGDNEAGKSSLLEAIQFGLFGKSLRVQKKMDYPLMVRKSAKSPSVSIETATTKLHRNVKDGKAHITGERPNERLLYVIDAGRLARLSPVERRQALFGALGIQPAHEEITERLTTGGMTEEQMHILQPHLRLGFTAAHEEAKNLASEARGAWKSVTGEVYGVRKGETWTAPAPEADPSVAEDLEASRRCLVDELRTAKHRLTRLQESRRELECPYCRHSVVISGDTLSKVSSEIVSEHDIDAQARRIEAIDRRLTDMDERVLAVRKAVAARDIAHERTQKARYFHHEVLAWSQAAEALAPDGIPGDLLKTHLAQINERLSHTARQTGWAPVSLTADLDIRVGNLPYALQSESAQWRADAAIAETLSYLSGTRLLALDRIDMLSNQHRATLMRWIDSLADTYDSIILLGTFNEPPQGLPASIAVHWMENGRVVEKTKAAA